MAATATVLTTHATMTPHETTTAITTAHETTIAAAAAGAVIMVNSFDETEAGRP